MLIQVRGSVNEYKDTLVSTQAIFFQWGRGGGGGGGGDTCGTYIHISCIDVVSSFGPLGPKADSCQVDYPLHHHYIITTKWEMVTDQCITHDSLRGSLSR